MSRPLAFSLAVFWSLQVLVCLGPAAHADAPAHSVAGHEHASSSSSASHAHSHVSHGHAAAEGSAPHSHAPGHDSSPSSSDPGCAQHCASLSQTVSAPSISVAAPTAAGIALTSPPAQSDRPRTLAGAIARHELERSPPDILVRNATLRV